MQLFQVVGSSVGCNDEVGEPKKHHIYQSTAPSHLHLFHTKTLRIPMGSSEEEACLFAIQLGCASVLPMVLKSAIELDLLELIKKAGPGAFVSPAQLAEQIPTKNPEAKIMLDRMLRLLASYSVLNCSLKTLPDGGVERLYSLTPVCKFLTKNEDGVSMAPLLLMNQDKILMESW